MTKSKRQKDNLSKIDRNIDYNLEDGIHLIKELTNTKFDETIDIIGPGPAELLNYLFK